MAQKSLLHYICLWKVLDKMNSESNCVWKTKIPTSSQLDCFKRCPKKWPKAKTGKSWSRWT